MLQVLLEMGYGAVVIAGSFQDFTQTCLRLGVFWVNFQGLLEVRGGSGVVPPFIQAPAPAGISCRVVRVERQGLLKTINGAPVVPLAGQGNAQPYEGFNKLG